MFVAISWVAYWIITWPTVAPCITICYEYTELAVSFILCVMAPVVSDLVISLESSGTLSLFIKL